MLAVIVVGLAPNLFAGGYNLAYNYQEIISRIPEAKAGFWTVENAVNSTTFPLGLVLFYLLMRPVARALRDPALIPDPDRVRRRCLALGHYGAGISIGGWVVGGFAYPIGLRLVVGDVPTQVLLHFFVSLILSGLMAAAYPFFTVTFLAVRVLYPALLRAGPMDVDRAALDRLGRLTWFYSLVAASVPMLAMTVLALAGVRYAPLLAVLGVGGLAGFGLAFWLARAIQADLATLAFIAAPSLEAAAGDERGRR
jgi:hypothetical protein